MEFKVIIYIIAGVLYFLYTMGKRAEAKRKEGLPKTLEEDAPPVMKPVSPPVQNPLEDIMREIKRKQAETDAQKRKELPPQPKLVQTFPQKKAPKEMLIREKKKGVFEEGNYERDLTDEEKIVRGKLKIENEGIYKIKSMEEETKEQEDSAFQLNLRDAVIGSIILERKY